VALAELARVGGVPTPCVDAVIDIASIVAARPYRNEGLTRERMGIAGMKVGEVTELLRSGRPREQ
jgi:opine dehydrogenase